MHNNKKSYVQNFKIYLRYIFQNIKLNSLSFPRDQSVKKFDIWYITEIIYFQKVSYFCKHY
jgi:abortive infection bacteriophage resistance protein